MNQSQRIFFHHKLLSKHTTVHRKKVCVCVCVCVNLSLFFCYTGDVYLIPCLDGLRDNIHVLTQYRGLIVR